MASIAEKSLADVQVDEKEGFVRVCGWCSGEREGGICQGMWVVSGEREGDVCGWCQVKESVIWSSLGFIT